MLPLKSGRENTSVAVCQQSARRLCELTLHGSHMPYKSRLLLSAQTASDENSETHTDMAEEAPAVAAPAKAKAAKKKTPARSKKTGPTVSAMILSAVAEANNRKGMSLAALKKVLAGKGVDVIKANKRINLTVSRLVANGKLVKTTGTGASGSFKLNKEAKAAKPVKKDVKKKKTPVKAKKPAAKKAPSTPKKKVVKKTAKKKTPTKKVAKKPAAKKAAAATVKKAAKKAAPKKTAAKKTPTKKAPAKKAAPKKSKK